MSSNGAGHIFSLHGRDYEFHKLTATKGLILMTRLSRLFGDATVRLLVSGGTQIKSDVESVSAQQLDALAAKLQVFERLKDDDILDLARIVFPYVLLGNAQLYKGNDNDIDMKFAGYELDLLQVLWEAIKFNLGPFFEGLNLPFARMEMPTGLRP